MPKINVLDKNVAELIAAGEVIERPASVIKELVENSLDAGAKNITVEIKRGGISYIRIADNGCGMAKGDVPLAFLRHATSKVYSHEDLENIQTLGFRGEALASVCAMAKVELRTKRAEDVNGTLYIINGSEEQAYEECGCPEGTTIIIRDLFFNTPARLKFLKRDVTEANNAENTVSKLALSNPFVSFKFIRDGRQVFSTVGNGDSFSAVYGVLGKQFASSLIQCEYVHNNIGITGFISSPLFGRGSRNMQSFFVNGRYFRSPLCVAALEEGFKNSLMVGKFPACVLNINLLPAKVDVNVHPAKTEVRFSDEKSVFNAIYFAVKNALLNYENAREIPVDDEKVKASPLFSPHTEQKEVTSNGFSIKPFYAENQENQRKEAILNSRYDPYKRQEQVFKDEDAHQEQLESDKEQTVEPELAEFKYIDKSSFAKVQATEKTNFQADAKPKKPPLRVIGELFHTYILCEAGENLILMDKHAAHERINFEKIKRIAQQEALTAQYIAFPERVKIDADEYNSLLENKSFLLSCGIDVQFLENNEVELMSLPSMLDMADGEEVLLKLAGVISKSNYNAVGALLGDLLHSMSCKASVRANDSNRIEELEYLAKAVYNDENIRFCPHGRPIMTIISKTQLEKYFGRIQS